MISWHFIRCLTPFSLPRPRNDWCPPLRRRRSLKRCSASRLQLPTCGAVGYVTKNYCMQFRFWSSRALSVNACSGIPTLPAWRSLWRFECRCSITCCAKQSPASIPRFDPALFDRPKSGFVLPIGDWTKRGLKAELDRLFADNELIGRVGLDAATVQTLWSSYASGKRGLHWSRVWSIYVLLAWCRSHDVLLAT